MYSRNRAASGEERYTGNIPPMYNGSRFSYAKREYSGQQRYRDHEDAVHPDAEAITDTAPEAAEAASPDGELPMEESAQTETCREDAQPVHKEVPPAPTGPLGGLLSGIGQEELLLIALLLLLSAEHERAMDIIVILLLLIGIH